MATLDELLAIDGVAAGEFGRDDAQTATADFNKLLQLLAGER